MVGASKILTVSYGTFSCTLEGFDDSFSTMKAIAEYFRDLAADDRYFGAEPPTPDAEMLARIAEREIERRVEARFDGESVVLRAAETAPAAVALAATQPDTTDTPAEDVAEPEAAAPEIEPEIEPEIVTETAEEPVEEPVVEEAVAEPEVSEPEVAHDEITEEDVSEEAPAEAEIAAVEETPAPTAPEVDDNTIAAFMQTPVEAPVIAEAPTPTPVPHPDEDSIAAKLQRIRAVVAPGDDNQDSIFEEEDEQDAIETETALDIPEFGIADDDVAPQETESLVVEAQDEEASDDADDLDLTDEIFAEETDDLEEPLIASNDSDDSSDDADIFAEETDETTQDDSSYEPILLEDEAEEPISGRVIKVKSSVLEEALADTEAEDVAEEASDEFSSLTEMLAQDDTAEDEIDEPVETAEAEAIDEDDLSDEEEADLLAELAKVSEEINETETPERHGAAILASLDDPEPAVDRIFEKTNDALEEPESGRNRDAFSHLKAAVAATEADRKMRGNGDENGDETETYRDDLAKVVRPKRATAPVETDRVRPSRPTAPLKLVAEQRVDTPDPDAEPAEDAAPVRPRRISHSSEQTEEMEGGFAEFAQNAGAHELPDLLEAAAAYTAFVEGRDNFTRPQVMRRAAAVAGKDNFSREDCLRSFGQLLREGKINKLSRGQFVVSEETRFRPDARIAGE